MLFIIILLLLVFIVDIAAMLWGYDSRDTVVGQEWEGRHRHELPFAQSHLATESSIRISHMRSLEHIQKEFSTC